MADPDSPSFTSFTPASPSASVVKTDADRARVLQEFHGNTAVTAKDKLRAFEDDVLGKDASRINGEIERGIGSRYAAMTPHQKAHYAALEHLVKAEKAAADASAALADAEAKHETAKKASDAASKAAADAEADDKAA